MKMKTNKSTVILHLENYSVIFTSILSFNKATEMNNKSFQIGYHFNSSNSSSIIYSWQREWDSYWIYPKWFKTSYNAEPCTEKKINWSILRKLHSNFHINFILQSNNRNDVWNHDFKLDTIPIQVVFFFFVFFLNLTKEWVPNSIIYPNKWFKINISTQ